MGKREDLCSAADEIERDYRGLNAPFPYADCRKLLSRFPELPRELISDLDYHFSTIAGYASRGRRLLRLNGADLEQARNAIARSFFEKHQEYRILEAEIAVETTPDLFRELESTEKIRMKILELLRAAPAPGTCNEA